MGVPGMRIEVVQWDGPSLMPTSQTCTNQLNLPVYTSREALLAHLEEAMLNNFDFHERQG
eukprot:NODE_12046_length_289_cov_11.608333_g11133_i0.p2 GENE.NODE_12046_length_289_cov_11.608333_g11133_i0~~NODE_12046_length_289_cov_11.608333_g11133_i0.p2  ORF type:complete len:68 (-),score=19.97 NODE_12046_length_289_cov_11.608333_g11133_i0:86-265(-)